MAGNDAEPEPRAVHDSGRHRHTDRMVKQRLARAAAGIAGLRPCLAPAAAHRAGAAHRDVEGYDEAMKRFHDGESQLRGQDLAGRALAEKGVAHAFDDVIDRWKVDRHLVGKAVLGHTGRLDGVPSQWKGTMAKRFGPHDELATR
jgi:hypothetical protein